MIINMFEDLYSLGAFYTLLLVLLGMFLLWFNSRRPAGLPPGPPALIPILGNLVDLDPKHTLETMRKYRTKYGDIFSLKMGSKLVIMINGYVTIKDILVKNADDFSNRPDLFLFTEISQKMGLAGSSGALWKEHRTFSLSTLRRFGFGKRSLESDIVGEIQVCLKTLEETKGKSYDLTNLISTNISNVTCALVFGKRFEHTDPKFTSLLKAMEENLKLAGSAGLLDFVPFLIHIPGDLFNVKKIKENFNFVEKFILEFMKEHRDTYDENNIRDYIDAFIKEGKTQEKNTDHTFTEKQLLKSVLDLFGAGTETTATAIRWAVVYFLQNPEVQERMKNELDEVIGLSRFPSMNDRSELPYCEAVIAEVLRCGNIAPLSLPHAVDRDVTYKEFSIPKESIIIPNLDSVLYDPITFPEPDIFNPSRFIDKDGKLFGQEKVLAFSTGRRVCLGEALARMELFLFLTAMVQRFEFLPEDGLPAPSSEYDLGITRSPKPYKCRAIQRL